MNSRLFRNLTWLILGIIGCSSPDPESTEHSGGPSAEPAAVTARQETPLTDSGAPFTLPLETWDVHYIQQSKVGHAHTTINRVTEDGVELLRAENVSEMKLQRFGQTTTQEVHVVEFDSLDGQLRRFDTSVSSSLQSLQCTGVVEGNSLKMEMTSLGKTVPVSIPWDDSFGGFFAADQRLLERPMKPGEERSFDALVVGFNQVARHRLIAKEVETTRLLDSEQSLLMIEVSVNLGGQSIDSTIWTNEAGETLKSYLPGLGLTSYRCTKEQALADSDAAEFDLGTFTTVKVPPIPNAHATKRIVYEAILRDSDPQSMFTSGLSQAVEAVDDRTVRITVVAVRPDMPPESGSAVPPQDGDLSANSMIQSDDARVIELARSILPEETDPWKLACGLESLVHNRIRQKNFSQAFATAAEVAVTLEGDCTEHAVLLAALCRARKIPARVAIGLVYAPSIKGFGYHMWNEVWVKDRWIPMDATLGRGGIGAAHIKLVDADLEGASAYTHFLPVFKVLGQLQLKVVEVK